MEEQVIIEFIPDITQLDKTLNEIGKGINDELGKAGGGKDFLKGVAQGIAEETKEVEKLKKSVDNLTKSEVAANKEIDKFAKSMNQLSQGIAGGAIKQGTDNIVKIGNAATKTAGETTKLTTQLRALREQLGRLDEGSAEFQRISIEAAKLEDRIGDVSQRIRALSSDTFAIDAVVDSARAVAGAFSIAQGAAALFGDENQDLQKALLKVQASLAVLNGLQEVSNFVTGQSAGKIAIVTAAQKVYAFVTNASTFATRAFNLAMVGLGVGAVIAGVIALVTYWEDIAKAIGLANDEQDEFAKKQEDFFTKNANAVNKIKLGQTLAQKSTKDLNEELSKLQEQLEVIGRQNTISEIIFNGQTIKTDATKARETILAEIDKIQAEIAKRTQSGKVAAGASIGALGTQEAGQIPTQEIKIAPVLDEDAQKHLEEEQARIRQQEIDAEKEKQRIIQESALQAAQQTFQFLFEIGAQQRRAEFDQSISDLNKRREAELANKELTEAQRLGIDKKYKAQERQLRIKQFNEEKQAKIAEATMNGFLAITATIAKLGAPIPPNFAAIAGVALAALTTSLNIARIASTKPPAFKKGTKGAKQSAMSIVGEEGAELMYVPQGAKIVPHSETMKVLSGHPDTNDILSRFNIPVSSPKLTTLKKEFNGYDFSRLEKAISKNNARFPQVNMDKNGIVTIVNEENSSRTYYGQRYSSR